MGSLGPSQGAPSQGAPRLQRSLPTSLALALATAVAALVFVFDYRFDRGVAIPVLYVAAIGLAHAAGRRTAVWGLAATCVLLTSLGWLMSADNPGWQYSVLNRGLAMFAIVLTALFSDRMLRLANLQDLAVQSKESLIGELERQREKLRVAEQRYRLTIDSALDAVITIDAGGIVTSWNCQAERTFGWTADDAVGQPLERLIIPPQHRAAHLRGLERMRAGGSSRALNQRLELSALHRDGSEFPIELSIARLDSGSQDQFSGFIRDMSAQQRMLAALHQRERTITNLLNSTAEGIYGLDLEGHCTFANAACARLLGYESPAELLGANMHQRIHHSRADGTPLPDQECNVYRAFRQGRGVHVEDEVLWRRDGTSFDAEYWSFPVTRDGEVEGAVVTFLDISVRKQLERDQRQFQDELETRVAERSAELVHARDRLELALTGANVGLWDWNARTNQVYYSPTYKLQLGYPADVQWNHFDDWESRLHPEDRERSVAYVHDYFAGRIDSFKPTFRMRCADGSYRWMLSQGRAFFDDQGKPTRVIGVHVDISERIESQQELERLNAALATANEALEQSNLDLQQFASAASHDLQAPLRAIASFSQFLKNEYQGQLDETADDYIDRIASGVQRMKQLIHDLLEFSRLDSQALPLRSVALNETFDDALQLLQAQVQETAGRVTREDLPQVSGDPAQLSRLLQNLIGNALKYRGDQPPQVHVSAAQDADRWTITVQDNGIGIPEAEREKVFEIFRRLHRSEDYPGTGIGLAICRRIIHRHGGQIWIESAEGGGTAIRFSLPDHAAHK